jgi:hypothetical protein
MHTTASRYCLPWALAGALALAAEARAEPFVDLGLSATHVRSRLANEPDWSTSTSSGLHVGIGARRVLRGGNDIGVRLEVDDVDSDLLLAVRALDYRFNRSEKISIGVFLGAARLDLATPAYGYYLGCGVQFKELLPGWDLGLDLRRGDKIARDNVLPTDPQGGSPDNFYDLTGLSLYLSRRF